MNKKRRLGSVEKTFARAFRNYLPPESLTVSQWAEKYRILSREASAEAGPWRNARTPYMVEPMDAFSDPNIQEITIMAPSQSAKSEVELNIIGYVIDQDPGSMLYIQPNLDDAKKFSRLRIAPMIRDCPRLRKKVADIKSRDSANTSFQKTFPGGMLTIVGSQSPSGLASTPARYILGDELDRWALSAGTEGDPWSLATARTTTFYNRKLVAVSSPTIKGASKIEDLYNQGTQEKWHTQCPFCGEWVCISFDDMKFEYDTEVTGKVKTYNVKSVIFKCPKCKTLHSEKEMREQPAKWIAQNPSALQQRRRSFWINAFSSPWRSWTEICQKFLESKSDPQKFKAFFNTVLGESFEDRGGLLDEDEMLARREDYGKTESGAPVDLPEGVLVLTCGVDTQDDRLEYEVVGHGHYGETWGIKKGLIMGDPADDETWLRLDEVVGKTYTFADGKALTIAMTFVDSGGHKTQSVYMQCKKRFAQHVFAIKGQGGEGVPYTRPPTKVKIVIGGRTIGETYLYSIGVDAGKSEIMAALKVQSAGPKYCHFPRGEEKGYDLVYFNGLLSEKLVLRVTGGRTRWAWGKLPGHERNEGLDCRNYAMAAFRALDPDMEAAERRLNGLEPERKPVHRQRVKHSRIYGSDMW